MPKIRDLVNAVVSGNEAAAFEAFRRALVNPRHVLACFDLAAKLNKELGAGQADGGLAPVLLVSQTLDAQPYYRAAARSADANGHG